MSDHVWPIVGGLLTVAGIIYGLISFFGARHAHRLRLNFERRFPDKCFACATYRHDLTHRTIEKARLERLHHWPCKERPHYTVETFLRDLWIQFQAQTNDVPMELLLTAEHADALEKAMKERGELQPGDDIRDKRSVLYGALIIWNSDQTLFR